jgi:hypothetical protein
VGKESSVLSPQNNFLCWLACGKNTVLFYKTIFFISYYYIIKRNIAWKIFDLQKRHYHICILNALKIYTIFFLFFSIESFLLIYSMKEFYLHRRDHDGALNTLNALTIYHCLFFFLHSSLPLALVLFFQQLL